MDQVDQAPAPLSQRFSASGFGGIQLQQIEGVEGQPGSNENGPSH
jgi:hypothetical protein